MEPNYYHITGRMNRKISLAVRKIN